ncbi:PadR family transcriptional regulator [Deinococcus cellulosilyticus]|uniref:Transcription regulator PadR N-terminal domain-containing protein n=1 Tax=Deinococcus cellulosilyticus (strain DSM 18568 / NBRC 106333 / KACC 11606 / 5516J-15) TaxID=1223518 RepID=A0A511MW99_DEIC1|nr:PadR family transcriptional regulator [Deinococcus cellulosilyticus]GEM44852.1 hypothetical protein DC3_04870 [Deinococcus cellulosilyticus NBRC 106333 = KACC 11606]
MHRRALFIRQRWHQHQLDHHRHHSHHHAHEGPHERPDFRRDPREHFGPQDHPEHPDFRCSPFGERGRRGAIHALRHARGRGGPGPRVKPGNVRAAILALLSEGPFNGYQIIQEIAQRSDNVWKPSSGSVYPALQQLIDEGLIQETVSEGKRAFTLTEAGSAYCKDHPEEIDAPWKVVSEGVSDGIFELRATLEQLIHATQQVASVGTPDQVTEASKLLIKTRKALYKLLAEDDEE